MLINSDIIYWHKPNLEDSKDN